MFPEFRELTLQLREEDTDFSLMYQQHQKLDDQIKQLCSNAVLSQVTNLENLKRQKLQLKDQMYLYLQEKSKQAALNIPDR